MAAAVAETDPPLLAGSLCSLVHPLERAWSCLQCATFLCPVGSGVLSLLHRHARLPCCVLSSFRRPRPSLFFFFFLMLAWYSSNTCILLKRQASTDALQHSSLSFLAAPMDHKGLSSTPPLLKPCQEPSAVGLLLCCVHNIHRAVLMLHKRPPVYPGPKCTTLMVKKTIFIFIFIFI